MREKLLAICDRDERYLHCIQEYFQRKGMADFTILTFSELSQAAAYSARKRFEIFLIGENAYSGEVSQVEAQKIYLLWEDGENADKKYPAIVKFQAMGEILAQVMEDYAQDAASCGGNFLSRKKTRLITFYSPDRADGQTAAALAAGQALTAAGQKVLYLNLRAFAGFEKLLHTQYEADVTDYFYFVLQYADKALYKLEGMRKSVGGLDYLPPALDYADLLQITGQQWETTIDTLLENGNYEVIILDISEICQGFYQLLARSDDIIFLTGNSRQAEAVKAQYEKLLTTREAQAVAEKTSYGRLPDNWEQECTDYEHLSSTRLGEQMKQLLAKAQQTAERRDY